MLSKHVDFEKDEHIDEMGVDSLENLGSDLDPFHFDSHQNIETTENNQSIDELINWYLTSNEENAADETIIQANESATLTSNINLQERLQNYIDKNRIVYADTGEELNNINVEDLTFLKNRVYLHGRQILSLNGFIKKGIYVIAETGRYVDLTRNEINNIPIINGKKMFQGSEIITESAYIYRNTLVFAINGIALTEAQKMQIVLGDDGQKYLNDIEIVTKAVFNARNTLVFATNGIELTDFQKSQIILGEDGKKYLGGIKVVTKSHYHAMNLVFASNGIRLTEAQKTQLTVSNDGKKHLGGAY